MNPNIPSQGELLKKPLEIQSIKNSIIHTQLRWIPILKFFQKNYPTYITTSIDISQGEENQTSNPPILIELQNGFQIKLEVLGTISDKFTDLKLTVIAPDGNDGKFEPIKIRSFVMGIGFDVMPDDLASLNTLRVLTLTDLSRDIKLISTTPGESLGLYLKSDDYANDIKFELNKFTEAATDEYSTYAKTKLVDKTLEIMNENILIRIYKTFLHLGFTYSELPHVEVEVQGDLNDENIFNSNLPRIYLENGDCIAFGCIESNTLFVAYKSKLKGFLGAAKVITGSTLNRPLKSIAEVIMLTDNSYNELIYTLAKVNKEEPIDKKSTADGININDLVIRKYMEFFGVSYADKSKALSGLEGENQIINALSSINDINDIPTIFNEEMLLKYFVDTPLEEVKKELIEMLPAIASITPENGTVDKGFIAYVTESKLIDGIINLLLEVGILIEETQGRFKMDPIAKRVLESFYDEDDDNNDDEDDDTD